MSKASRILTRALSFEYPYLDLTGDIIGAAYSVHHSKGFGLNCLKASGLSIGLVVYFGPRLKIKRVTDFSATSQASTKGKF